MRKTLSNEGLVQDGTPDERERRCPGISAHWAPKSVRKWTSLLDFSSVSQLVSQLVVSRRLEVGRRRQQNDPTICLYKKLVLNCVWLMLSVFSVFFHFFIDAHTVRCRFYLKRFLCCTLSVDAPASDTALQPFFFAFSND